MGQRPSQRNPTITRGDRSKVLGYGAEGRLTQPTRDHFFKKLSPPPKRTRIVAVFRCMTGASGGRLNRWQRDTGRVCHPQWTIPSCAARFQRDACRTRQGEIPRSWSAKSCGYATNPAGAVPPVPLHYPTDYPCAHGAAMLRMDPHRSAPLFLSIQHNAR